ncbi:MAG: hypothetical protein DRN05_04090 [Thermoplasmata archaeon]|nr:MAG: hypothetical protein DRN05_04090 [Thermoplasmata archaeon]
MGIEKEISTNLDEELRKKTEKRTEGKIGFYIRLSVCLLVNLLLVIVWWFTNWYQ